MHSSYKIPLFISIHALVKRATLRHCENCVIVLYFNPRPREEGDKYTQTLRLSTIYFNPRPREEGDRRSSLQSLRNRHFNPRPREEGDSRYSRPPIRAGHFNPRPREEGDRKHSLSFKCLSYFNPRPREEGDLRQLYDTSELVISIHALVKRATSRNFSVKGNCRNFNPRPREEGDFPFLLFCRTPD